MSDLSHQPTSAAPRDGASSGGPALSGGGGGGGVGGGGGGGSRGDLRRLFDGLPPHSAEAEMALLGSMLLDADVVDDVVTLVSSGEAFFHDAHAAIFDAVRDLHARTQSVDLVQLAEMLKDRSSLDAVGGLDYLAQLAEQTPSAVNAVHYARLVRDKACLRGLIDASSQIIYDAFHAGDLGEDGVRAVLDEAERRVFEIAEQSVNTDQESLKALLEHTLSMLMDNEGRRITGLATNFFDLDEMTSGLQPGEMVVVAARPSMGKTAFALNLAEQIAFGGSPYAPAGAATPVGFFSMEMSRQSVAQRLLCARANVDSHKFRTNMLRQDDYRVLMDAAAALSEAPLYIDDTPGLSAMMLRAKARRMVARHGVKCLFVDYLQLMSGPASASRDGRQQEVSAISRGVKALARELSVPVVCLAQLNRGAEQREGHRPRMADLRESGSIEQDADVVLLLHREAYYHTGDPQWADENPDKVNLAEVIIAKQRNGPTGVVRLTWDPKATRFRNMADADADAYDAHAPAVGVEPKLGADPRSHTPGSHTPGSRTPGSHTPGSHTPGSNTPGNSGPAPFAPGKKTGPVDDFRDGGGDSAAPWDDDAGDDVPI